MFKCHGTTWINYALGCKNLLTCMEAS
uniref:Uncharacterized protein n=1 Tax=Rhizophora mucronata TaxID=61149 RepID=A0A2P2PSS9_RHIMU